MGQPTIEVQKDHERAQTYAIKYGKQISDAFMARASILNLAMNEFNHFLSLPEKSNNASSIWDAVWLALSTAVPALRLAKFVESQHTAATLALEIAKATGQKGRLAKTVKTVTGAGIAAGKIANKANDIKEKAEKAKETLDKATAKDQPVDQQFAHFDVARKVLYQMLEDLKKATKSWETAMDAELTEYENRIDGLKASKEGSLENYIKGLLQPYPEFTNDELLQIETRFLWEMIAEWARNNVKVIYTGSETHIHGATSVRVVRGSSTSMSTEGINGTQREFIVEKFGAHVKRGKFFLYGPVSDAYTFLLMNRVPSEQRTKTNVVFTPSSKM